jgi:hypothetical protein
VSVALENPPWIDVSQNDPLECLRDQLEEMRVGLIRRLTTRIEGGDLALVGSVQGAIAAVEAELAGRGG